MKRMKVLFFDSWTRGIHNFLPLSTALAARDVDSLLVHRGSWGTEPGRPTEEVIEGLRCRDIRYHKHLIYRAISGERPSVVLMLTTNYIADRAVILAARALGVQTCFLMHGIRHVSDKPDDRDQAAVAKRFLRSLRWQRAYKYARYTLPNYFLSGMAADRAFLFRTKPYRMLWQTFRLPERYVMRPRPSAELHCDRALVWADVYRDLFVHEYGYPPERVRVVGHPPLDPVFRLASSPMALDEACEFRLSRGLPIDRSFVVYLEDSFPESGFEGWTAESRLNHLSEIAGVCAASGRMLIIKLHPTTDGAPIEQHFRRDSRVRVVGRIDLPRLVSLAEAVIGHISSTVDIAIALGKVVAVPRWGISASVPDYFVHRGVGIGCESPEALQQVLSSPGHTVATNAGADRERYVDHFITWRDGRSVERIVSSLIEQGKQ